MTFGVVMLCHEGFDRAAQVARIWAAGGCPVMIHVDARVPKAVFEGFRKGLAGLPGVDFSPRFACEWGTWGIVAATLAAVQRLMAAHPGLGHVYLASGACLPLRPVAELSDYLARNPQTDFIESVTTADAGWTVAGLNAERFTLWFPFAFRRRRWLFDRAVAWQRALGLARRVPEGIDPHLGSQWWCLTRATLTAILSDPRRTQFERYFRHVWIPDESYFQTLARRHARRLESRSLTLSKFDFNGRPHLFHDDHETLLRQSRCFVARKIWRGANGLYSAFPAPSPGNGVPEPDRIHRLFARAEAERLRGRPGLYNQARFPRKDAENGKTAAPFAVMQGFDALFPDIESWLARATGMIVHGRLFRPGRVDFAGRGPEAPGALPAAPALRDYDPRAFLTNLIWAARSDRQAFLTAPGETAGLTWFMATDPNARILAIRGAWIVPLARSARPFEEVRRRAVALQRAEAGQLEILASPHVKARVEVFALAEAIADPAEVLGRALDVIGAATAPTRAPPPGLAALEAVPDLVKRLHDSGLRTQLQEDLLRSRIAALVASSRRQAG